jgi:outer membrane protein, heavy metal efflux system
MRLGPGNNVDYRPNERVFHIFILKTGGTRGRAADSRSFRTSRDSQGLARRLLLAARVPETRPLFIGRRLRRGLALVLCSLGLASGAAALDEPPSAPPATLRLADARSLALAHNWEVLAAKSDLDLAEAQRIVARALPNPEISATLGKLNSTNQPPGATPNGSARDTVIALGQLVEIGKRGNRVASAQAGIESARARFEFARTRLDAAVVKAYVAALAADGSARIDRASSASLARAAEIASARLDAGEIAAIERDQIVIAAGRFEADTHTAETAAVQARIALQVLLGAPRPDGDVVLADDLDRLRPLGASLASRTLGVGAVLPEPDARLDVRAASSAVAGAAADLKLQRALRIPDPTFLVQYERDVSLPEPNSIGVGVSLNLPILSRNKGGIREAEVAHASAARGLEQTRVRARSEMATARAAYAAATERRALVRDGLLPRAEGVQQTVAFAYEKGGASLLELLEAERNLNDLRLAALGTEADALAAAADFAAALGETLEP